MALKRFLGSILSATPPTVGTTGFEDSSASGRWSPSQILSYIANAVWPTQGSVPTYVDDVFSTYLYESNAVGQTIENGIALGDANYGSSVEFDGASDYLSRSSGLSGQADSHTFTLSIWVFNETPSGFARVFGIKNSSGSNNVLYLQISSSNALAVSTLTDGASEIQKIDDSQGYIVPPNQWSNIIVSANTSTSTWHLSINDSYSSVTPQSPLGYTDDIDFSTSSGSTVGTLYGGYFKGRITQLYLDNTFRDLSQTSVRRTFINADGTPATGLASLSPVLYLPLDDTNSIGTNSGTGGTYTVNGSPTQLSEGGPYIESGFGKGGLVWIKNRDGSSNQNLVYVPGKFSTANNTATEYTSATTITSFNTNGFTLGSDSDFWSFNWPSGQNFCSWTFRQAPGFFDVVTYTGDGVAGRTISHDLGSVPGCIIVISLTPFGWNRAVYHGSLANSEYINLNTANGAFSSSTHWNNTTPTSSVFTVGTSDEVNRNTDTYVAFLFADDDQRFGDTKNESIIKCGSYTGNGSATGPTVNLGWEPQWLLIKRSDAASDGWVMVDIMRGLNVGGNDNYLYANSTNTEASAVVADLNATGFQIKNAWGGVNTSGGTYIYIAIRRPMKTPTAGTEVFTPIARTGTGATAEVTGVGFAPDMLLQARRTAPDWPTSDRLRGAAKNLGTPYTQEETTPSPAYIDSYDMDGVTLGSQNAVNGSGLTYIEYFFKRAPGFFDVVAYTGTGSNRTISHGLGITPSMVVVKNRTTAGYSWQVWHSGYSVYSTPTGNYYMRLNSDAAIAADATLWNGTEPTASEFSVGTSSETNRSSDNYIAYLFGEIAGISKLGSYTATGSDMNIDCGFTSGARFILIKRVTPGTGDWFVWDTARGISAGSDPYMYLNSTAAEVTGNDYIDPYSAGFTITSSATWININTYKYIFFAVA